jgi:Holliday junction DNA helicase RuvA
MIEQIKGEVTAHISGGIILSIGPLSLQIQVTDPQMYLIGQSINCYTYFHWNSETGPQLFGFLQPAERTLFIHLIGCNGVGPKLALTILTNITPSDFLHILQKEDVASLSKTPGIGTKKAEQLIVQLKHKLDALIAAGIGTSSGGGTDQRKELAQVLESLNYSRTEIQNALSYVTETVSPDRPFDHYIRAALTFLSKNI